MKLVSLAISVPECQTGDLYAISNAKHPQNVSVECPRDP
jgi:hypothetical protein